MAAKKRILILGGYGVFGRRIAAGLAGGYEVVIAGRNLQSAKHCADELGAVAARLDIRDGVEAALDAIRPWLVINCVGPFQGKDYRVPRACIARGIHYIDLADARAYVAGFATALDADARQHGVVAITGASTVPAVSAAIMEDFLQTGFREIHAVNYGVTPGNRTPRGVATVAAILSYVGHGFLALHEGNMHPVHGWQDLHREQYPGLGPRWMSRCDIPDLDLFPQRYPALRSQRFYAGLELSVLHLGLWLLSWPARWFDWRLECHAAKLRRVSLWFYRLGSNAGGMHFRAEGIGPDGHPLHRSWYLIARNGDGPQVPATPPVILARKLAEGGLSPGALTAAGLVSRAEIMQALDGYDIEEVLA